MAKQMRFYLKIIGNMISIYHRPSHQFLEGVDSEEQAVETIREFNALSKEGLWRSLLLDYHLRLPHKEVLIGARKDAGFQESEDSYAKAWRYGTEQFYEKYPDLLVEEDIPYDLIHEIHIEENRREEKRERERLAELARWEEEMKGEPRPVKAKIEKVIMSRKDGVRRLVIRVNKLTQIEIAEPEPGRIG